jgi:glycerol-3-phosphate dehydrogenase (NAD(P)+)
MSRGAGETVGVVGAGAFGTALSSLLSASGRPALIWSQSPSVVEELNQRHSNERGLPGVALSGGLAATGDPAELAERVRFIVLAVPSAQVRDRLRMLGDHLDGRHIVLHTVGDLAAPDNRRVSEVIGDETPVKLLGALAGPALPRDLSEGRFASMVAASAFDEVTAEARRLLSVPPRLRIYCTHDLIGVELSATLASAYTMALGMSEALEIGVGPRAVLVTRIVAEATRLVAAAGGEPRTFAGLSGLGNLLVRSASETSEGSPSFRFGKQLGRGQRPAAGERTPVGVRAAEAAAALAQRLGERAPVLEGILAVLEGKLDPARAAARAADTVAQVE